MPRLLPKKSIWNPLKKSITKEIITPMVEQAKQEYGRDLKLSDQKRFESAAKAKMDVAVNKVVDNYRIDQYGFLIVLMHFATLVK